VSRGTSQKTPIFPLEYVETVFLCKIIGACHAGQLLLLAPLWKILYLKLRRTKSFFLFLFLLYGVVTFDYFVAADNDWGLKALVALVFHTIPAIVQNKIQKTT